MRLPRKMLSRENTSTRSVSETLCEKALLVARVSRPVISEGRAGEQDYREKYATQSCVSGLRLESFGLTERQNHGSGDPCHRWMAEFSCGFALRSGASAGNPENHHAS